MRNAVSNISDYIVYVALRIVICIVQLMPLERCERGCSLLAIVLHRWVGLRNDLVLENLHRVFPDWTPHQAHQTTGAMWKHLFLMICEIAHAPKKIRRTNWYEHFLFSDQKLILKTLFDARAKIVVTGHFGNFEMAGYVSGLFGLPSTTLARPLDNVYVHNYITRFRSLGGQHFLSKDGVAPEIQRLLEGGGTLGLLADQNAGNRGCWVKFLGHPTSCHKALALFTLSNQAPMMVCYNRRMDQPLRFEMVVTGVADPLVPEKHLDNVQSLTQWYNDCLELAIRKYPDQYWWIHRRWRQPPSRLKRASERMNPDSQKIEASASSIDDETATNESQERAA
ncbi:MAG: lysophospholipid acyltransferase family protein [Pirellulaceae bacterium]|nr:lysophospholipid acyltransferase family protein [Pirellulaceae bacterium]